MALQARYTIGDKVFAKVNWPAKLTAHAPRGYNVFFYGTSETGLVKEDLVVPYTKENVELFSNKYIKKKHYASALDQILNSPENRTKLSTNTRAELTHSPATGLRFTESPTTGAELTQSPASGLELEQCQATGADLTQTPSTGADLTQTPATGADLTQTPATGAEINQSPAKLVAIPGDGNANDRVLSEFGEGKEVFDHGDSVPTDESSDDDVPLVLGLRKGKDKLLYHGDQGKHDLESGHVSVSSETSTDESGSVYKPSSEDIEEESSLEMTELKDSDEEVNTISSKVTGRINEARRPFSDISNIPKKTHNFKFKRITKPLEEASRSENFDTENVEIREERSDVHSLNMRKPSNQSHKFAIPKPNIRVDKRNAGLTAEEFVKQQKPVATIKANKTNWNDFTNFIIETHSNQNIDFNLTKLSVDDLGAHLIYYFKNVMRYDGKMYNASCYTTKFNAIKRHLRENDGPELTPVLLNKINAVISERQRQSTAAGETAGKHRAFGFTCEHMALLKAKGQLGHHNPDALRNLVYTTFNAQFGMRPRLEMYTATMSDIEEGPLDDDGIPTYLNISMRLRKNMQGRAGAHGSGDYDQKMQRNHENPELCGIVAWSFYKSKKDHESAQPDSPLFHNKITMKAEKYQNAPYWYGKSRAGINTLGDIFKVMVKFSCALHFPSTPGGFVTTPSKQQSKP